MCSFNRGKPREFRRRDGQPVTSNLTRDEAATRSALITVSSYQVDLDLTGDEKTFRSVSVIGFACAAPGASTFVNLTAPAVHEITLNDEPVGLEAFDGDRITLTGLAAGNVLRVTAACAYSHSGEGLHRFADPADGRVYLYSDLETFDAHRIYACFDQPDMKASYELTVIAPADWQVVANMAAESTTPAPGIGDGEAVRWHFPPTPVMSTYITAVAAGPYHVVRDEHDGIPLGVFCRQSLAPYLDADEIFEVTRQGFDFFHSSFGIKYPFGKYDQLFVPEFSAGAMENIGAVTFHESFIFRSKVTEAAREDRANVILHEMAHMWFGDLVTMRWWDDLWLNESFATFMSVFSQVEATRFKNGWVTFANQYKAGARRQDQLPTTHPITADVPDIQSVYLNFDAITYNKGACVLRQLVAYVGQDTFLRGVQRYVKQRQYSNASLADFLSDVEAGSGRDLKAWSKLWLETAGLNTLRPEATSQSETIGALAIKQEAPPEHPTIRPHRLAIGLYDRKPAGLQLRRRVELDVADENTAVGDLVGERLADLMLVNDLDLTYAKIRLDERSLATAIDHLAELKDPLARAITWAALWDMLRDGEIPARRYLPLILKNIHGETDIGVVQDLLAQASSAIWVYGDPTNAETALKFLADHALTALDAAPAGSDLQLTWAHAFISAARSPEHLSVIRGLLDGIKVFTGLKVDTDLRWSIVSSLAGVGADDGLIDAELKRDPTDEGHRYAAAARATRPTQEAKEQVWAALMEDLTLPLATMRSMMRGFHRFDQRRLLEAYSARYFQALANVWKERDIEVSLAFIRMMFPTVVVGEETVKATDKYLAGDDVPGPVRRILLEGKDNMLRAMRGRAADAKAETVASQR